MVYFQVVVKNERSLLARLGLCVVLGGPGLVRAWEPGTYPAAPQRMHSAGFSVDNRNRNDVVAFWHAVYQASEGYEKRIAWSGNYTGNNGTVSAAFVKDVERRLNYFRAMSGVDSSATMSVSSTVRIDPVDKFKPSASTLKSAAAQSAALMLVRNHNPASGWNPALTHDPPSHLTGWSPMAWNAAAKGNFAFGVYGPGAVTEYLVEQHKSNAATSSWNSLVGHRRWCLYPKATVFATGDQPGASAAVPPTNVLYVMQKADELGDGGGAGFVSYPAAGFFPAAINSPFWSLSRAGADFSSAVVSMTTAGGAAVPVSGVQWSHAYGDPSIVWQVGSAAGIRSVYHDTTFHVRVSGIGGQGVPAVHHYSVTLINPDRLTSNQRISGPGSVVAGKRASYRFTSPVGAEALRVAAFRRKSTRWTETAEVAKRAKVIGHTTGNYPLIAKTSAFSGFGKVSGTAAFRLTFPTSYDFLERKVPEQSFEINRDIIAKSKAKLTFKFRRGYMTRGSRLVVESSSNGGVTWNILGAPIKGVSDTRYDATVTSASRPLAASSTPIRIRFRYFTTGGAIYTHEAAPKSPTGIFIDDITTVRCDWLEKKKVTTYSATTGEFVFKAATAGAKPARGDKWYLRLGTRLGGRWFPDGPVKQVRITAP